MITVCFAKQILLDGIDYYVASPSILTFKWTQNVGILRILEVETTEVQKVCVLATKEQRYDIDIIYLS